MKGKKKFNFFIVTLVAIFMTTLFWCFSSLFSNIRSSTFTEIVSRYCIKKTNNELLEGHIRNIVLPFKVGRELNVVKHQFDSGGNSKIVCVNTSKGGFLIIFFQDQLLGDTDENPGSINIYSKDSVEPGSGIIWLPKENFGKVIMTEGETIISVFTTGPDAGPREPNEIGASLHGLRRLELKSGEIIYLSLVERIDNEIAAKKIKEIAEKYSYTEPHLGFKVVGSDANEVIEKYFSNDGFSLIHEKGKRMLDILNYFSI